MRAHDALAGTTAKCTGCSYDVEVPTPEPEPPVPAAVFDREAVEAMKSIDRHLSVLRTRLGCIFYMLGAWFIVFILGALFVFLDVAARAARQ